MDVLLVRLTRNIYIRPLSSVQNKLRFICMNRTTFRVPWEGGGLVKKHVSLRFVDLLF